MRHSHAFLLFACVVAILGYLVFPTQPNQPHPITQSQQTSIGPFQPELVINTDDAVCQPFMTLVDWEFGDAGTRNQEESPINSFERVEGAKIIENFAIRYDVPIGGRNEKAVILESRSWLAGSQTYHLRFVSDVPKLSQIFGMNDQGYFNSPNHHRAQEELTSWLEPVDQSERDLWNRNGNPISEWREPEVLTSEGRSFFRDTRWAYPGRPIEFTGLVEILDGGKLKQVCSARIAPNQQERAQLEMSAGMYQLNHMIDEIAGGDRSNAFCDRGAARANARLVVATTKSRNDALIRPWALASVETARSDVTTNLEQWALQSVRASDLLRDLKREIQRTGSIGNKNQPTLVNYYQSEFSVDTQTALLWADHAIRMTLNARFGFSGNYDKPRDVFGGLYMSSMEQYFPRVRARARNNELKNARPTDLMLRDGLRFGISARRPIGQIEWILRDARDLGIDLKLDNYVLDAAHNAELVDLLVSYGANVNVTNGINKTALMSAAHFGNAESVEYLIEKGVDTNLTTNSDNPNSYCSPGLNYDARTALMYAVENAPPSSILRMTSALLNAGASPNSRDSKGRTIEDYLALNTEVPDSIRSEILELLETHRRTEL